ncbi:Ankyrin-2 [Penicillium rolfsii]|nr:Ankyrin-2 [Penicillium rolfsii]
MPAKAPRIPNKVWDQHKEEIISFYLAPHSLDQTMKHMEERYGFRASKNQYNPKLTSWGIGKNVSGSDWANVSAVKRKRSQEGKESEYAFFGRKITRQKLDKEIARHVPLSKSWCISEKAVLPDCITVFTPRAESIGNTCTGFENTPSIIACCRYNCWSKLTTLLVSGKVREIVVCSIPDTSLELAIKGLSSHANIDMPQLAKISNSCLRVGGELRTYLPPVDMETHGSLNGLRTQRNKSPVSMLGVFLAHFVFLSTNNLIFESNINEICDWIVDKGGAEILLFLCRPGSLSREVFARKVLCSALESGNVRLLRKIIQRGAHLLDVPSQSQRWATHLSRAVHNGHEAMVELLCEAGVPPKVRYRSWDINWESQLPVLQILLKHGANPESFITKEAPGFPLVDAAGNGSLGAVKLLLNAKARVNLHVSQRGGTALQAAISKGHLEVAKFLVQSGADVNVPSVEHLQHYRRLPLFNSELIAWQTPVQLATKVNDLAILRILLENGALAMACPISILPDSEAIFRYPEDWFYRLRIPVYTPKYHSKHAVLTALQYAVSHQNLDIVELLLFMKVDPDSRVAPGIGDTPLQMSARLGNFQIAKLLLSNGADVNAPPASFNGRTAIQGAAESGHWKILSLLQAAGAHINAPAGARLGMTALQAACMKGHSLMAGFLLAQQADINAAPSPLAGLTSIQAASVHGDIRLVKDLISLGADANAPETGMGSTALVLAVKHKSLPLLKILLQNGAYVNPTADIALTSPLREAVRLNWLEGVKFLLRNGANVDDTPLEFLELDEYFDFVPELLSPLGWAISNGNEELVNLLVRHGAGVLATVMSDRCKSRSALIYALWYRPSDLDIINVLFANIRDLQNYPEWKDVLETVVKAVDKIEPGLWELILEKTSLLPSSLRYEVIQNGWNALSRSNILADEENLLCAVELFIKAGADLNSRSKDGSTLLQRIAGEGYRKTCCFLVDRGAAINIPAGQYYGTALQEAIKYNHVEVADFILEHGADVNSLPALDGGVTALQAASINGMLEMTIRLLECGADVSAPAAPENGRTAIDGAAERGYLDMVQLLLNAYGEQEALGTVCNQAAGYAEKEGHCELARWLRAYAPV